MYVLCMGVRSWVGRDNMKIKNEPFGANNIQKQINL